LSLALKWADDCVDKSKQPLVRAIGKITADAARVIGLPAGQLSIGSVADVCLFDPAARWTVEARTLASQGKHTPFLGYELAGQVKTTIVGGHVAFERA
jgi:dihydroorotase